MKIIATHNNDDIILGVVAALSAMHINCFLWDSNQKPIFDMFEEIRPDYIICRHTDITNTLKMAISEYNTKVILFTPMVLNDIPNLMLTCYPRSLPQTYLTKKHPTNVPYLQLGQAANLAKFCNGHLIEKYKSDIFYFSDIPSTYPNVLNMLSIVANKYQLRLVGPEPVPLGEYGGYATLSTICNMMKSTNIALDFLNKHMLDYAITKTFCLSTTKNDIYPYISTNNILEILDIYVNNIKLRNETIDRAYEITKDNTYFNNVAYMFNAINRPDIALVATNTLQSILNAQK